jgi:hypothetical protein
LVAVAIKQQLSFIQCKGIVMKLYPEHVMVVLQSHMDLLKSESGLCEETCLTSCHDRSVLIKSKDENVTDTEEDDGLMPETLSPMKTEHEVSCMALYHRYLNYLLSFSSLCPQEIIALW